MASILPLSPVEKPQRAANGRRAVCGAQDIGSPRDLRKMLQNNQSGLEMFGVGGHSY